jgi:hypothetical protein
VAECPPCCSDSSTRRDKRAAVFGRAAAIPTAPAEQASLHTGTGVGIAEGLPAASSKKRTTFNEDANETMLIPNKGHHRSLAKFGAKAYGIGPVERAVALGSEQVADRSSEREGQVPATTFAGDPEAPVTMGCRALR